MAFSGGGIVAQPPALQKSATFGAPPGGGSAFGLNLTSTAPTSTGPATATVRPFSFGGSTPSSSSSSFPTATSTGGPAFGGTQASAPLSFGTPGTTSTSSLNFGTGTSMPSLSFLTSNPPPPLSFGGTSSAFGAPGATTSTLSFAAPSLTFGAPPTSQGQKIGAFGVGAPSSSASTSFRGLGGTELGASESSASGGAARQNQASGEGGSETPLPNEIRASVHEFQAFLKSQKSVREQSTHFSVRPIHKVRDEVAALSSVVSGIRRTLGRNRTAVAQLKEAVATDLGHAEMAQRTQDVPPGLQYENVAPQAFFERKLSEFDSDAQQFRKQIELLEEHLKNPRENQALTIDDLRCAVLNVQSRILSSASQLQTIHDHLSVLSRSAPLTMPTKTDRRGLGGQTPPSRSERPSKALGPSPFPVQRNLTVLALQGAYHKSQTHQPPSVLGVLPPSTSNVTGLFGQNPTGSLFGNNTAPGSLFGTQNSTLGASGQPFQLQVPPAGNKRGKRF